MTQAFKSQGTELSMETAPGVWLHLAELKNISPSFTASQLNASNHDTPSAWAENIGGSKSATIALSGNYLPADTSQDDTVGLWAAFNDGENRGFRLTTPELPGGDVRVRFLFSGVITEFSPNFNFDALAEFTSNIAISGAPTYSLVSGL
jgi:predicted secreted protein